MSGHYQIIRLRGARQESVPVPEHGQGQEAEQDALPNLRSESGHREAVARRHET